MSKARRIIPATEFRVRLGEVLRSLEDADIVIEKGGIPVAILTKYSPSAPVTAERTSAAGIEAEYERALGKRAEAGGWERMDRAMAAGWAGLNPEEAVANIYRWRAEGGSREVPAWDGGDAEVEDD